MSPVLYHATYTNVFYFAFIPLPIWRHQRTRVAKNQYFFNLYNVGRSGSTCPNNGNNLEVRSTGAAQSSKLLPIYARSRLTALGLMGAQVGKNAANLVKKRTQVCRIEPPKHFKSISLQQRHDYTRGEWSSLSHQVSDNGNRSRRLPNGRLTSEENSVPTRNALQQRLLNIKSIRQKGSPSS